MRHFGKKNIEVTKVNGKNIDGRNNGTLSKTRLEIYGLYKQATMGDIRSDRPSGIYDNKEKAMWDAWKVRMGMSQSDAQKAYVEKLENLGLLNIKPKKKHLKDGTSYYR